LLGQKLMICAFVPFIGGVETIDTDLTPVHRRWFKMM
jgi:hypothetical protein